MTASDQPPPQPAEDPGTVPTDRHDRRPPSRLFITIAQVPAFRRYLLGLLPGQVSERGLLVLRAIALYDLMGTYSSLGLLGIAQAVP